jgi:hypothetical protein
MLWKFQFRNGLKPHSYSIQIQHSNYQYLKQFYVLNCLWEWAKATFLFNSTPDENFEKFKQIQVLHCLQNYLEIEDDIIYNFGFSQNFSLQIFEIQIYL